MKKSEYFGLTATIYLVGFAVVNGADAILLPMFVLFSVLTFLSIYAEHHQDR